MTNEELIALMPLKQKLKDKFELTKNQIQKMHEENQVLQNTIELLDKITEVYDGVPIHLWNLSAHDIHINCVIDGQRWATKGIIPNHNGGSEPVRLPI